MIVLEGEFTLGGISPLTVAASASADAVLTSQLPVIQLQLAQTLQVLAQITITPPTLLTQLAQAVEMVATITAAITAGVPDAAFQLTALTSLVASLTAQVAALEASLDVLADINVTLAVGGVAVYSYGGRTDQCGPELAGIVAGGIPGGTGATPINAVILATSSPATWEAMKALFGL